MTLPATRPLALGAAAAVLLTALVAGLTVWLYVSNALTYIDNGDGLYLYAAQRVARGAALYRQVMGTQPPVVYALGALAFKVGLSLQGIRLLSAAMRVASIILVYVLGIRLFRHRPTAIVAALLYAVLPIGATWGRLFDVNPLLTFLTLVAAVVLTPLTPRSARLAGLMAALCLFTKNLYLPIMLVTCVYLLRRRHQLAVSYAQGLIAGLIVLASVLVGYAGSSGVHDAFLGQASSPLDLTWVEASVAYVLSLDGLAILVAVAGVALYYRREHGVDGAEPAGSYAPWLLLGTSAILVATLKQGTFGTVFQCAEPALALLSAYGVTALWRPSHRARRRYALAVVVTCVATLAAVSAAAYDYAFLSRSNALEVMRVATLIRLHARPGAVMLEPPYYAILTGTRIPYDASDIYLVGQNARRGDPRARAWVEGIVRDVAARRFPVIVTDERIIAYAGLANALRTAYHPVYNDRLPPSVHSVVWLP